MKVSEAIQRIQSLYSKGVASDDSRLSDRHIYSKLVSVRSKLIREKLNKKQKLNHWMYQTIPCIELVEATVHDCDCLPDLGCTILKTKDKLPKPIADLNRHIIEYVTSIDGDEVYSESSWLKTKYNKGSKYTNNKPNFFIRNNYMFITGNSKKVPKLISISGVFEDPIEAFNYESFCNKDGDSSKDCISNYDLDFNIDADMVDTLIELSLNEVLVMFSQAVEDKSNNSADSPNEKSK